MPFPAFKVPFWSWSPKRSDRFEKIPVLRKSVDEDSDQSQSERGSDDTLLVPEYSIYGSIKPRQTGIWVLSLNLLVFMGSVVLFIASKSPLQQRNYALRQVSEHSPIFDKIDIPMRTTKMNATLVEPDPIPIYRQPPSPEVDAAWNRITNVRPIVVSKEDVIKFGKNPEQASKWPESFGFGSEAYIGRIDVFHQIHCLDTLRKEAYFDHYYGKKWPHGTPTSDLHQTHLSHCIYILLQNLMCTSNVDVYTHIWADANYNAFPDFSLNHKCRDFEAILAWQEENSIDVPTFGAIRKPAGYKAHVMTHRFKELFGWFNHHVDDGAPGEELG